MSKLKIGSTVKTVLGESINLFPKKRLSCGARVL